MRRRLITVLLFAVLAAFVASSILYRAIAARAEGAKPATATVLVAARNLGIGALVSDADVRAVAWPGPVSPNWAGRRQDVVGRGVISPVNAGEPFPENRLAPKGAGAGLAATIPAGMRAVAVKVDEVVGVSGFVLPGMRVDVLSSGTPPGASGVVARTILQNIEVLSAGRNFDRDVQGKPDSVQVVNLLVTPEQAEALSLASTQTRVQLVLRNLLDTAANRTQGISMNQLLMGAPAEPPKVSRPKPKPAAPAMQLPAAIPQAVAPPQRKTDSPAVIEVINGQKRELVPIRETAPEEKE